jgi:hypothetical protein
MKFREAEREQADEDHDGRGARELAARERWSGARQANRICAGNHGGVQTHRGVGVPAIGRRVATKTFLDVDRWAHQTVTSCTDGFPSK